MTGNTWLDVLITFVILLAIGLWRELLNLPSIIRAFVGLVGAFLGIDKFGRSHRRFKSELRDLYRDPDKLHKEIMACINEEIKLLDAGDMEGAKEMEKKREELEARRESLVKEAEEKANKLKIEL